MKKLVIVIVVIVCVLLLSRFMINTPETTINYDEITEVLNENVAEESEEIEYSFEYTDIHFSHEPNEFIKVTITYPQFKDEKLSTLNTKIEEYAKSTFKEIMTENADEDIKFTLEETHSVKLVNENLVSISSTGELNILGNAYPTIIKNSLNINPTSSIRYKISDFININDEFVQKFREQSETNEQFAVYLTSFSNNELKDYLLNSKMFFNDKNVVVIYEVPHAIGDYVEIEFSEDLINPYLLKSE